MLDPDISGDQDTDAWEVGSMSDLSIGQKVVCCQIRFDQLGEPEYSQFCNDMMTLITELREMAEHRRIFMTGDMVAEPFIPLDLITALLEKHK
jgi:hypothetical protein